MKRTAFTMIELIFVIVILGILAAVAIPRLSATKDDAKATTLMADVKTCITDLTSYYQSQGTDLALTDTISCVNANANGASITYSGNLIVVTSSGSTSLDGNYTYKGTSVIY